MQVWHPELPDFDKSVQKKHNPEIKVDKELHIVHPATVQVRQFDVQAKQELPAM